MDDLYKHFCGRPTPIFYCENLSKQLGGADIYLKREDLNHLGAHKLNNALGQLLLAKRMGKTRIIAETGAGQHGVATAAVSALYGLKCTIYMGEEDIRRQELNVLRMRMMGAEVIAATSGQKTLKEAVDEALEAFVNDPESFYVLGSAVGPYPYPEIVHHFQSVISFEAREQFQTMTNSLPDMVVACVGGGSNAIGMFPTSSKIRTSPSWVRNPAVSVIKSVNMRQASYMAKKAFCTALKAMSVWTKKAKSPLSIPFPPDLIILPSARNTPI